MDPFATGVLRPEVHDRLVQNVHAVARRSGLGPAYENLIWNEPTLLAPGEEAFIKDVVVHRKFGTPWTASKLGIAYGPSTNKNPIQAADEAAKTATKMRELTAKMVRNFVDARLMSPAEIVEYIQAGEEVEASVLLVRDFLLPEEWALHQDSKFYSKTQRAQLDVLPRLLMDRAQRGAPTVVHVRSPAQTLASVMPSVFELFRTSFACQGDLKPV
jgi:hypothetical protein